MTVASDVELGIRPLTARSIVLSLLLGAHPAEFPVRDLVRVGAMFDVNESTVRASVSRMVAAGDLVGRDSTYRLSDRLLQRQRRQDERVRPATVAWTGEWELAVITAVGRTAADRARLRADLTTLGLAELREGTWLRPANLARPWPASVSALAQRFLARPDQPGTELAATLWDLPEWARVGHGLLTALRGSPRPTDRFTAAAAVVRHLLADPLLPTELLPAELLPARWPADALRAAYAEYQAELMLLVRDAAGQA